MAEDGEHLRQYLQTTQAAYNEFITKALNNQHQKYFKDVIEKINKLAAPLFDMGTTFKLNDIWQQMREKLNTDKYHIVNTLDNYLQEVISETSDPPAYAAYDNSYLGGGRRRLSHKARRRTKRRRHRSSRRA